MTPNDYIQLGILAVLFLTLIVIFRQIIIQNRLLKLQVLRDRFEMYFKTLEPISEEEIKELDIYPGDYMDEKKYENYYKKNHDAKHKYIWMLWLYKYFMFCWALKKYKFPDPVGYDHTFKRWLKQNMGQQEFLDVHEYLKPYYPKFYEFVENMKKSSDNNSGC